MRLGLAVSPEMSIHDGCSAPTDPNAFASLAKCLVQKSAETGVRSTTGAADSAPDYSILRSDRKIATQTIGTIRASWMLHSQS